MTATNNNRQEYEGYMERKAAASPMLQIPLDMLDFDVFIKARNGSGSLFKISAEEAVANEAIYIQGNQIAIMSSKVEIHFKAKPEVLAALSKPGATGRFYDR